MWISSQYVYHSFADNVAKFTVEIMSVVAEHGMLLICKHGHIADQTQNG
mgnify:CR=1 FL=1